MTAHDSVFQSLRRNDFVIALGMALGGGVPAALLGWLTSWASWSGYVAGLIIFPVGAFIGGSLVVWRDV